MESDLFELLRPYLGKYRHCEQHVLGISAELAGIKIDAAEVGVAGQINGEILYRWEVFKTFRQLVLMICTYYESCIRTLPRKVPRLSKTC